MKEAESDAVEMEGEPRNLIETVVAAHYLSLQMRLLVRSHDVQDREATEFLAAALTEWAHRAGGDLFDAPVPQPTYLTLGKH